VVTDVLLPMIGAYRIVGVIGDGLDVGRGGSTEGVEPSVQIRSMLSPAADFHVRAQLDLIVSTELLRRESDAIGAVVVATDVGGTQYHAERSGIAPFGPVMLRTSVPEIVESFMSRSNVTSSR